MDDVGFINFDWLAYFVCNGGRDRSITGGNHNHKAIFIISLKEIKDGRKVGGGRRRERSETDRQTDRQRKPPMID